MIAEAISYYQQVASLQMEGLAPFDYLIIKACFAEASDISSTWKVSRYKGASFRLECTGPVAFHPAYLWS